MPEVPVGSGWSDWRMPTTYSASHPRGIVSDTPGRGIVICYSINEELGTGIHHWYVDIDVRASDDTTVLLAIRMDLPISVVDLGPFGSMWYIQNERITSSVPDPVTTLGDESQQPTLEYPDGYDGTGPIHVDVYTAHYLLTIPAGAIIRVAHAEVGSPNLSGRPIFTSVWQGGRRRKRMLLDPVSGDQVLPRIENEMLVVRTQLHDGAAGPRDGLSVNYGSGQATAAPGSAVIGYQTLTAAAALTVDVPTSGTVYLFLKPTAGGGIALVTGDGPQSTAAWCVGRVRNGSFARCSGVLVADGVTEAAPARKETGALVLRYDTADAEDVEATSSDRGVTWQ
jgi:hypothetical protein